MGGLPAGWSIIQKMAKQKRKKLLKQEQFAA
jgi:hypothetical protein